MDVSPSFVSHFHMFLFSVLSHCLYILVLFCSIWKNWEALWIFRNFDENGAKVKKQNQNDWIKLFYSGNETWKKKLINYHLNFAAHWSLDFVTVVSPSFVSQFHILVFSICCSMFMGNINNIISYYQASFCLEMVI